MKSSGQNITLSICMMVKNEESNLYRCLPSLTGIADELILIDTGSTDNSISVAESFGAKVYSHPWENNFSVHRNQSIGYASGDWVFIIDADEELFLNSSASELKEWLNNVPADCMSIAIILKDIQKDMQAMQFNSVRLFRRGSVQYEGIVHNMPKIIIGKPEAIFCPLMYLKHYGYDLSPEKQEEKRNRTEGLLLKRIEENLDDVTAYFYLVQLYTAYREYPNAAEYIEKYEAATKRVGVKFNGSIYCTACHVYRQLFDKVNAQKWLLAGMKEYPKDLDLLMALTEYGVWVQEINLIVQGANGFLRTYEEYQKNPALSGNRFTYANTAESVCYCLFHLSMAMFQQGCHTLDKLNEYLGKTHIDFNNGIRGDVAQVFEMFGLKKDGWELRSNNVINLSKWR